MATTNPTTGEAYSRWPPLILGLIGVVFAVTAVAACIPELQPVTVEKTVVLQQNVYETKTVRKTVTLLDGRRVEADVEEDTPRTVPVEKKVSVAVPPTPAEQIWIYGMIAAGVILTLCSVGAIGLWFYFVVRTNGKPPPIVTEMMKYFASSFMGVFVGFLGWTAVGSQKQAVMDKPPAVVAPPP